MKFLEENEKGLKKELQHYLRALFSLSETTLHSLFKDSG